MANMVQIGNDIYRDNKIISGSVQNVLTLNYDELMYDTAELVLDTSEMRPTRFQPRSSSGMRTKDQKLVYVPPFVRIQTTDASRYQYGQTVVIQHGAKKKWVYYVERVTRVGETKYNVDCVSGIGLLSNIKHYGGLYEDVYLRDVMRDIIGESIPYELQSDEIANLKVSGWLPIASKRENRHQLMIAYGLSVTGYNANWAPVFGLINTEFTESIPDNRIFLGGDVKYEEGVDSVSVTEHTFASKIKGDLVTLFEGRVEQEPIMTPKGVETLGILVEFNEPMITPLQISGGPVIFEQDTNYAVISPGDNCKLTGYKCLHTTRQIERTYLTQSEKINENSVSVSNATLVSFLNSEGLANRLYNYYSKAREVSASLIPTNEYPGESVQFDDPFKDTSRGIITSMNTSLSNKLKTDVNITVNYNPYDASNPYQNVEVIRQNGQWTVPKGIHKIRAIIVGGGEGGWSGYSGKNGDPGEFSKDTILDPTTGKKIHSNYVRNALGGKGGQGGQGGRGGKISIVTLLVTPGQTFDVIIGVGGSGGRATSSLSNPGYLGKDTYFGEYTSKTGIMSENGIFLPLIDFIPASNGKPGVKGGDGDGCVGSKPLGNIIIGDSVTGPDGVIYKPGKSNDVGISKRFQFDAEAFVDGTAWAGFGGGAALGSNGIDGNFNLSVTEITGNKYSAEAEFRGGTGGPGADATLSGDTGKFIGVGGQGGPGGGGGGGGGVAIVTYMVMELGPKRVETYQGQSGTGGHGGNGGRGADGGILIYY